MQNDQTIKNIRFIGYNGGQSNSIMTSDEFICCQSSQGAISCFFPPISVGDDLDQLEWNILDVDVNAATNNITLNASGTNKINGASSVTINTNGGSVRVYAVGVNDYLAVGSVSSGSSSDPIVYTLYEDKTATAGDSITVIDPTFNLIVPAGTYTIDMFHMYLNNNGGGVSNCAFGLVYNFDTSITSYNAASDVNILSIGQWGTYKRIPALFQANGCHTTAKVTLSAEAIIKPIFQDAATAGTFRVLQRCLRAFKVTA